MKMKYLILLTSIASLFIACEDKTAIEAEARLKLEQAKQDSIAKVMESMRQREIAQRNLKDNVRKMCELQLIALENAQPTDSARLEEFTLKMKSLYPSADRGALRRIAMNIEPCEEYRVKSSKNR